MTPAELHTAVVAAVTTRLELAKAAHEEIEGNWSSGRTPWHWAADGALRPHILANLPGATIRHCEADLATLEDHRPRYEDDELTGWQSWWCDGCGDASPCGELDRRADAYAVVEPLPPPA